MGKKGKGKKNRQRRDEDEDLASSKEESKQTRASGDDDESGLSKTALKKKKREEKKQRQEEEAKAIAAEASDDDEIVGGGGGLSGGGGGGGFAAMISSSEDEDEDDVTEQQPEKPEEPPDDEDDDDDQTSSVAATSEAPSEDLLSMMKKPKKKKKKKTSSKLNAKERRKLKDEKHKREMDAAVEEADKRGTSFAVSYTAVDQNDENWLNSVDVIVPEFTISAFGKTLFEDAELRLTHGRKYGLVGPNGMGKSTLLKQIASGELPIPPAVDYIYVEQEVEADDTPAVEMVLRADSRRTELMDRERNLLEKLENAEDEDVKELVEDLELVTEELKGSGAEAAEAKALTLLHGLGFTNDMLRAPTKSFSGGWRMRVSIARALFLEPTLVMLDEPTNHLDLNAVLWLDDYLQKWNKTLLIVSHDADFLESVCTDILHIEDRKLIYYRGSFSKFQAQFELRKEQLQKEYEQEMKAMRRAKSSGKNSKKGQAKEGKKKERERGTAKKNKGFGLESSADDRLAQERLRRAADKKASSKAAIKKKRPRDYVVKFSFPEATMLTPPIISVDSVEFGYVPEKVLFTDLNFGIDMDSRITIVGPNGIGKSTLLKLITGELSPTKGEVTRNRHLRLANYDQHFVDVLPMDVSPVEYLQSEYQSAWESSDDFDPDRPGGFTQEIRNRLGRFGLPGNAHTLRMSALSGGQKARVVFASMSFQAPHIIVLDEPTNNLDMESIVALGEAIVEFNGGVVLVSHDSRLIEATNMRLWVCERQTLVELPDGLDEYREEILTKIKQEEVLLAQQTAENQAKRDLARKEKLAKLKKKKKKK